MMETEVKARAGHNQSSAGRKMSGEPKKNFSQNETSITEKCRTASVWY
jgi:hypothetical protein